MELNVCKAATQQKVFQLLWIWIEMIVKLFKASDQEVEKKYKILMSEKCVTRLKSKFFFELHVLSVLSVCFMV